jgi:DNA-binding response OmpR family regulator
MGAGMTVDPRRSEQATASARQPILVVEDNPQLLDVLGMLLDYERYLVILKADGQEALDWLARQCPALLILDWRLPKVGGDRVLAATRERYGPQVPILVLSAVADSPEVRQAGADAYLRKPYDIEELVATIRRLLAA